MHHLCCRHLVEEFGSVAAAAVKRSELRLLPQRLRPGLHVNERLAGLAFDEPRDGAQQRSFSLATQGRL